MSMTRAELEQVLASERAIEAAWERVLDGPWAPGATLLELEDMRIAAVELASAITLLMIARERPPLRVARVA
jgi:hypothetical protein